jgi:hypothetical protein
MEFRLGFFILVLKIQMQARIFFNARIQIGDKLWAGNVELHINSSDWFAHSHQNDQAYDNVILHVVWNHNAEIYRMDGSKVDTLNLFEYVDRSLVQNYHGLINSKSWINCEKDFPEIDDFSLRNWLERLYIERLEHKSNRIFRLLEQFHNDWEQVLFILLMRNFGSKVNADAFESCALSIDYKTLCKISQDQNDLEALFFGQMGLLEESASDVYEMELLKRYGYLKHKYKLSVRGIVPLKFFRMRPANFPTIRLSQLAALYHKSDGIFSKIKTSNTVNELYTIFNVAASSYWDTHYNFGQKSVKKIKNLTPSFIQLLIINTVIPLRYAYQRFKGNLDAISLLSFAEQVPMEKKSYCKQIHGA